MAVLSFWEADFWARFRQGKASAGAALSPAGRRGDPSVAPRPPPPGVSVGWWPRRRPQPGGLSPSPTSVCDTVLVATEGTLAWPHVPVTRLSTCQQASGRGGMLSTVRCPHHPPSVCVTILGTSAWPPVAITHLCVCQQTGGRGGDLSVVACPRHPTSCVSPCQWLQRAPQCSCLSPSPASPHVSELVAVEGTSVWPPVAVTRLHVSVSAPVVAEETSVWPPVLVTHLTTSQ